jgi:hypothetical protein
MVAAKYQALGFPMMATHEIDRGWFMKLRLWQRVFQRWDDMDFRISSSYHALLLSKDTAVAAIDGMLKGEADDGIRQFGAGIDPCRT